MTRHEALTALLAKMEAGGNPAQAEWAVVFPDLPTDDNYPRSMMAVNAAVGYIDAAKALHEAVLPEWDAVLHLADRGAEVFDGHIYAGYGLGFKAHADNPARAWLIAILKALIAMEEL